MGKRIMQITKKTEVSIEKWVDDMNRQFLAGEIQMISKCMRRHSMSLVNQRSEHLNSN